MKFGNWVVKCRIPILILAAVIELSIFINLGLAHLTGTSLPFIAPICISTIQLGATVDYTILMTRGAIVSFRNKNAETSNT